VPSLFLLVGFATLLCTSGGSPCRHGRRRGTGQNYRALLFLFAAFSLCGIRRPTGIYAHHPISQGEGGHYWVIRLITDKAYN
jgi:hypothetical protein